MKYYTYILFSEKFGRFYYGQTQNLDARIIKHNAGFVKSTARFTPWRLVAYKECTTRSEAFLLERALKNCKSREKVSDFIVRKQFTFIGSQEVFGPEN
jgi:putative endonuclease